MLVNWVRVPEHVRRRGAQRVLTTLLATIVASALAAVPADASVQNSCRYNYDSYYRDMAIDVSGAATIDAAPPRYPAPTGSDVDPGQTIHLAGEPIVVALPANLPRFGYLAGLLEAGLNTITAKVWVAIRATNTVEGVQVRGPFTVTATTTIEVDPVSEAYVSDNGFSYSNPTLPDTTWTAAGGDVAFSQAPPGTLGSLPVGANGASRAVAGSVVIQANLVGGVSFFMDCQPGATQDVNPNDDAGPSFAPATAAPFDASISGPRNVTCLSAQGRLASGAAAGLPAGVTREIDPIGLRLTAPAGAATVAPGSTYTLAGAQAHVTLPAATVATLGNFDDAGTALVESGQSYPFDLWVAIGATNTVEATQTVKVTGSVHPDRGQPRHVAGVRDDDRAAEHDLDAGRRGPDRVLDRRAGRDRPDPADRRGRDRSARCDRRDDVHGAAVRQRRAAARDRAQRDDLRLHRRRREHREHRHRVLEPRPARAAERLRGALRDRRPPAAADHRDDDGARAAPTAATPATAPAPRCRATPTTSGRASPAPTRHPRRRPSPPSRSRAGSPRRSSAAAAAGSP